ncbi:hypothetical protein DH2020_025106 [Rehmannia glutinosa]|uniref:Glabrous enhancer-binding protein-like DBD domain-containing protein n=1 Tax=Rehmannia glutinosa TaxID=99300 RepID=A0ABR0W0M8_REHGL
MTPKAPSRSRQPSKDKQESSSEEEKMRRRDRNHNHNLLLKKKKIIFLMKQKDTHLRMKTKIYKRCRSYADMEAFYNFIKKKLLVDFSKEQLKTKIRGMKKRFLNALKKTENGGDPVFSKPHEDKAFELSKKIWGGNNEGIKNGENAKKDIVVKAEEVVVDNKLEIVKKEEDGEGGDFWSKYPLFSASFGNMASNFPSLDMSESMMSFVMKKLSSIGNDKAKELEEKWRQLIKEEAEVKFKMLTLMQEQVKMAFDQ